MHISVATIDSPEFINLRPMDINPFMSSCDIKVLYLGENRNHSYITKEVATDMAKTLRGAPIVGYFKTEKDDFADHGQQMVIDDEGIKFNCLTRPYGFVAPDAKVWFQKFEDKDDFGNSVTREYLMTTGYLWTHQFEEAKKAIEGNGRPQSMELDNDTLDGKWSTNVNTGVDFFIINDAIFTKLCILGEDVEPCFEGASVTAPDVSTHFTKMDDSFTQTLFTMMQDLKKIVSEGGQNMALDNTTNPAMDEGKPATNFSENGDNSNSVNPAENNNNTEGSANTSFAKKDDPKKKDDNSEDDSKNADDKGNKKPNSEDDDEKNQKSADDEDKKKAEKYDLLVAEHEDLQTKFTELQTQFNTLTAQCAELTAFKKSIDDAKKKELIDSFYMLSDEDKADVNEHFNTYSYDDIKKNLSVICFEKKVNFAANEDGTEKKENPSMTFNLNDNGDSSVPAWLSALKNTRDAHKI